MTITVEKPGPASTHSTARPVVRTVGLTRQYGAVLALDSLDLDLYSGEIFCLLGANGAGKTTTLNLLLGFVRPTRGEAYIQGLNVVTHAFETKRHLAYIPEQIVLYPNLSGFENLEYFVSLAEQRPPARHRLTLALEEAGLPPGDFHRRVHGYSKGMRQKVGIALALARHADLLLLDEPTSGLDPKASNEFSSVLVEFARRGAAVLMVTHDIFRAKETGTRVGIMKHGRLVETLSTEAIGHAALEQLYLRHMHD